MEDDLKKNEKWKMTLQKFKWKTTPILRPSYWADLTTKTSKTNGFDTIEIDLVRLQGYLTDRLPVGYHVTLQLGYKVTLQLGYQETLQIIYLVTFQLCYQVTLK